MSKSTTVTIKTTSRHEGFDNVLAAVAAEYVSDHPEIAGWDLDPQWEGGDDGDREAVVLTVPLRAVRINVTTTPYDGDQDFPEAAHFDEYVAEQLAERFPGAEISVEFGSRSRVTVYGDDSIDEDDVANLVAYDLWDEFCNHGYKEFSAE